MNLEDVTISIEPREVSGCLDLAVQFYRMHFRKLLALSSLVAVPALVLTWLLSDFTRSGLLWGLTIYFFASPVAGALIVAGAGHRVFGEPFSVRRALSAFRPHAFSLTMLLWGWRTLIIVASVGIVTPWMVAVREGFLPEVILLERLSGEERRRRIRELVRSTHTSPVVRLVTIQVFLLGLVVSFFLLVDVIANYLLGVSIWTGHGYGFLATLELLWYDPKVVTTFMAVLWLLYPLGRLAWFLCYLDQRIRNECWDVELDFRREARRLGS